MSGCTAWTWIDPQRQRALITVEDHIFWSYTLLGISREIMEKRAKGLPDRFSGRRASWVNREMSAYKNELKNISSLDRDDILAQNGDRVCAHCGANGPKFHFDHLIPASKLSGAHINLNQVRACPSCNMKRGNKDLMLWHRQAQTFPTLAVLRRYLKLCYFFARKNDLLHQAAEDAVRNGLPYDPRLLPRKFPDVTILIWDYAYPDT
jgi:5-methylcytosine-specific restriction endonuclease McrA